MRISLIGSFVVLVSLLVFSGCANSSQNNRISKVYESDYPEGITVSIYNGKIKDNISVSDARIAYGSNKRQAQFIVNNNSSDIYNLVINTEWSDKRGTKISTYPRPKKVSIDAQSGKRIIIDAPNYKAKDVLINIDCSTNCIKEK